MKYKHYKVVFTAVGLIGIVIIAFPTFANIVRLPTGTPFSELYLLGPSQTTEDIPFNVAVDQNYSLYIGVSNHLGSSAYYICYIKLRNQTDPLPNETLGTPSPLSPLYEYRVPIQNGMNWTAPLTFSISNVSISNNQSRLGSMTINNVTFNVDKTAHFDQENNGYFYQLIVELWAFDSTSGTIQYQNRCVFFWLNVTSTI